jgi:hypothetical protein
MSLTSSKIVQFAWNCASQPLPLKDKHKKYHFGDVHTYFNPYRAFLDAIGSMRGLPSMDSGFGHNFIKNSSFCLYMGIIAMPVERRT